MSQFVIVPAQPGFFAKDPESVTWNDVIAWRMHPDGKGVLPVTLWTVYGSHDEVYELRTPLGDVEVFE